MDSTANVEEPEIVCAGAAVAEGVRHIFVVPDGAPQNLTPSVLVTGKPKEAPNRFANYRDIPWLVHN